MRGRSTGIQGYWGRYLFGVLLLTAVAIRSIILYSGQNNLIPALVAVAVFALFYLLEPALSPRLIWPWHVYLALQTGSVMALGSMRPFLDVSGALFILLSVQATSSISPTAARSWNILFVILLAGTMILGSGLVPGLVIAMLIVAIGIFMVSYDALYTQTQADQAESQKLLKELQDAHQRLQEFSSQAEELVAANERNRLARELHDSVGQMIFSATLTARSAQLLTVKDPTRVPDQLEQLQEMTGNALGQLRSLITQMRPEA
jgi:signal transduction histidine kinase